MTDKVQKIREEVEKRFEQIKNSKRESDSGAFYQLKELLEFIDSMQEEPVSIDFEQELYKAFGQVKDFTLGMQIAKWFYDMGRKYHEPVSEEWIEELRTKLDSLSKEDFEKVFDKYAIDFNEEPVSEDLEKVVEEIVDPTVLNAYGVKEIANRLRRTMIEPISEELEEAMQHNAPNNIGIDDLLYWRNGFIIGAKWQKEKEYTCYEEAFEDGAAWKKEQMMAKAIDVEVKVDAGGYPYIPQMELYDYDKDVPLAKEGDKYKVVLIKED